MNIPHSKYGLIENYLISIMSVQSTYIRAVLVLAQGACHPSEGLLGVDNGSETYQGE